MGEAFVLRNCDVMEDGGGAYGVPDEVQEEPDTSSVHGMVMHPAQLDAWIGRVATTMDTEVGRGRRRQMLLRTLYGMCLRLAVVGITMVAWEAMKNVHTAKFDNDGIADEKRRAVCGSSEKKATVT